MKNKIDLTGCADMHTHSTASDGTMTPSEIAIYAKKLGLRAIALTDHDTLSGLREFCFECEKLGVEGIPGIELGAKYKSEMHILGLFVDFENKDFAHTVDTLAKARTIRNYEMLKLFSENGFNITEEDILNGKESMDTCGRVHFAAALVKKGYVKELNEAFEKYIAKGKPFYVSRKTLPPKETIELIHSAGGLAVLAHPIFISENKDELRALLTELKSYGLDGVESMYNSYSDAFSELCMKLCSELNLLPTGGSDFHADNKPLIPLGIVNENKSVPYYIVENLKKALGEKT